MNWVEVEGETDPSPQPLSSMNWVEVEGETDPSPPAPLCYELSRGGGGNRPQPLSAMNWVEVEGETDPSPPAPLFYELSRGGGGNRPQTPCPSLRKDGGLDNSPLHLFKETQNVGSSLIVYFKTPMLGLYMDTTGKRFFEFCFDPKLPARVHRFVWFVILWTPFLAFCKAALFLHDIPRFSYGRLWRGHKLKMRFHVWQLVHITGVGF